MELLKYTPIVATAKYRRGLDRLYAGGSSQYNKAIQLHPIHAKHLKGRGIFGNTLGKVFSKVRSLAGRVVKKKLKRKGSQLLSSLKKREFKN